MTCLKGISVVIFIWSCASIPTIARGQDNSQTASMGRQVRQAQTAVEQARALANQVRGKLRSQLESKPQWAAAAAELKKGQAAFDAAKKAALARLQMDRGYQHLRTQRREARAELASADSADNHLDDAAIRKATDAMFHAGLAIKQLEDHAFANDLEYVDAKARLAAARSRIDELEEQVAEALKGDPQFQQASQQLQSAEQQVQSARQQLAQAAQAEREARIQEEKAREQQAAQGQ